MKARVYNSLMEVKCTMERAKEHINSGSEKGLNDLFSEVSSHMDRIYGIYDSTGENSIKASLKFVLEAFDDFAQTYNDWVDSDRQSLRTEYLNDRFANFDRVTGYAMDFFMEDSQLPPS